MMKVQNESQKNRKGNSSIIIIVILIILVLGLAGYICYDKFLAKKENTSITNNCEAEKSDKTTDDNVNNDTEKSDKTTDDDVNNNTENSSKQYVNKVYANSNYGNTNKNVEIVLFENGKCVYTYVHSAASKCSYYIEDNKIYITRTNFGVSREVTEENEIFIIYNDHNNEEHIILENETDQNTSLKYLKVN